MFYANRSYPRGWTDIPRPLSGPDKAPGEVKAKWDYDTVKETVPGGEAFQPLATSKCRLVVQ